MEIATLTNIISLPQKDGNDKPLYDYEEMVFDSIITLNGNYNCSNKKHLSIKKAAGLGISLCLGHGMTLP